MAAPAPCGDVAVLLLETGDEGAQAFVDRVRASLAAPIEYGFAWANGNSGPMGLYQVAREMLAANGRVPIPAARAS
jgi:hypothetical protein